jgi:hypothetical protein
MDQRPRALANAKYILGYHLARHGKAGTSHLRFTMSPLDVEGGWTAKMEKQGREFASRRGPSNAADAMGLWFAALVLCAVFAAGVIVYETGNSDMVTASNDVMPAAAHGGAR